MASSFIYRPHVATLDGVITPDVLIDSLMIAAKGEAKPLPVPIDRMTMDIEMQVAGPGAAPCFRSWKAVWARGRAVSRSSRA